MTTQPKHQNQLTRSKVDKLTGSFDEFVAYYCGLLGFPKVGQIQTDMIAHMVGGHMGIRMHVFRGSSKTFLVDLYIIWRILRCPDTKVLLFSANVENASTHLKDIKKLLALSPMTSGWLNCLRTDNKTVLDFTFSAQEAAPSIRCVSVERAVEGSRADLIVADDVATGINSRSPDARAWLIRRMNEFTNIIHPVPRFTPSEEIAEQTQIIVVGTYYSQFSIYVPPRDGSGHPLKGFKVFHRAALDDNDESTFPERFPTAVLHEKRATLDQREWTLQYLLDLTAIGALHGVLEWDKILRKEVPVGDLHTITLTLDPVAERIKGRRHATDTDEISYTIAGLIRGPTGKLNRVHIIEMVGSSKDATEEFIRHVVVPAIVKHKVMRVQVESNMCTAYNLMRRIIVEQKVTTCGVMEPWSSSVNKHDRILSFLEPNINSQFVSFEPSVLEDEDTAYQLKDLTYMSLPSKDDRIDSLAQMVEVFSDHLAVPDSTYDTNETYICNV